MFLPRAAKMPVRSVSSPRLIVSPLMPVPVLTAPALPPVLVPLLVSFAFVLQPVPAAANARAASPATTDRLPMLILCSPAGQPANAGSEWVTPQLMPFPVALRRAPSAVGGRAVGTVTQPRQA